MAAAAQHPAAHPKPLILLIPDRDDGADDWMAIWERENAEIRRIDLGMWENPHRNTWVNKINLAIERAGRPVVLVARGLACVAVAWWAEFEQPAFGDPVRLALLVMPPDVSRPGADPRLARFTSCPRQPLPFRSFLAAGSRRPGAEQDSLRALALDWGMRAEFEQKAQATVLERVGRDMIGFIGGRDSLGNVQFPKSTMPVNPLLDQPEVPEDVRLADIEATVVSVTADRLNFTPDPPFDFGLVQFDNGARVLMEMVDRPGAGFAVGDRVRMRLRIKSRNARLGFRTYFWKAAPLARRVLENA